MNEVMVIGLLQHALRTKEAMSSAQALRRLAQIIQGLLEDRFLIRHTVKYTAWALLH